ncbi:hypothetical protein HK104_008645, partial [Borealophlyctis nickersoniae]
MPPAAADPFMPQKRPRTVNDLKIEAEKSLDQRASHSVRQWASSAQKCLDEGEEARLAEDYDRAYVLLLRGVSILLEVIPKCKDFPANQTEAKYQMARRRVDKSIALLEEVRKVIKQRCEEWEQKYPDRSKKSPTPQRANAAAAAGTRGADAIANNPFGIGVARPSPPPPSPLVPSSSAASLPNGIARNAYDFVAQRTQSQEQYGVPPRGVTGITGSAYVDHNPFGAVGGGRTNVTVGSGTSAAPVIIATTAPTPQGPYINSQQPDPYALQPYAPPPVKGFETSIASPFYGFNGYSKPVPSPARAGYPSASPTGLAAPGPNGLYGVTGPMGLGQPPIAAYPQLPTRSTNILEP